MKHEYANEEPRREEVDRLAGATLIEFGSPTCGHCRRAQPLLAEAMAGHADLRHLKIADGPGQPLGRSFRVKLWPTFVFFRDGVELERLVRPQEAAPIAAALAALAADGPAA